MGATLPRLGPPAIERRTPAASHIPPRHCLGKEAPVFGLRHLVLTGCERPLGRPSQSQARGSWAAAWRGPELRLPERLLAWLLPG